MDRLAPESTRMPLDQEIAKARNEVHTDGYSISIGEIINMYRDGDLELQPAFQRYFRWSAHQKTRLIESLLIGIPLPSIFVSQREDGVWDLVDGLQRLSTILEFVGELKDETGEKKTPIHLTGSKYLPSLKDRTWAGDNSIGTAHQRTIKRTKIDVKIVKKESKSTTKYELFQRLNTLGSKLSPQEVRNCVLIMFDKKYLDWVRKLANVRNYQRCIDISNRKQVEQYDLELVIRFLVLRTYDISKFKTETDIPTLFTEAIIEKISSDTFNMTEEEKAFRFTFKHLNDALGSNSFKPYNETKNDFEGSFSPALFEVLAVGIGANYQNLKTKKHPKLQDLMSTARDIWGRNDFVEARKPGTRSPNRLKKTVKIGRRLFA